MTSPISFKYRAFLSYSHADTRWARWLHKAVERFRVDKDLIGRETGIGPIPKSLAPVFRDREDFTAGHTLSDQTLAALDASATLVVICSPTAAKSLYVNEEIRLFKSRHPDRAIIPVIVDGRPGGGDGECFPPALRCTIGPQGQTTNVPEPDILAADARDEGDGKALTIAKVVARLIGLSTDEVFRRAERERWRRQRQWIAGLSTVALVLAALAGWAEVNRREAVTQRVAAERNLEVAKSTVNRVLADVAREMRKAAQVPIESKRAIFSGVEKATDDLAKMAPGDVGVVRSQVRLMSEVAGSYFEADDVPSAFASYLMVSRTAKEMAEAHPKDPAIQREYLDVLAGLSDIYVKKGMKSEILSTFDEMAAVAHRGLSAQPENDGWSKALALIGQSRSKYAGEDKR